MQRMLYDAADYSTEQMARTCGNMQIAKHNTPVDEAHGTIFQEDIQ